MDRPSKLADLTLVSKYYPVANYSYPRNDSLSQHGPATARGPYDRSSVGSQGSAPGLVDDRTDSEVSVEDDYQYHAHGAEIWDSFWHPERQKKRDEDASDPQQEYPALIPSPQRSRRRQGLRPSRLSPAWPLPEESTRPRFARPLATYSPFPKPMVLPPRSPTASPSWTSSREAFTAQRAHRPTEVQLPPCPSPRTPPPPRPSGPEASSTAGVSLSHRPVTPVPTSLRPYSTPLEVQTERPEYTRPSTALEHRRPALYSSVSSNCSTSHLHLQTGHQRPDPNLVHRKSTPHLTGSHAMPRSVFEEDESDSEKQRRSFFRFHKRSDSDSRRAAKVAAAAAAAAVTISAPMTPTATAMASFSFSAPPSDETTPHRGRRCRANTTPSPKRQSGRDGSPQERRSRAETSQVRKRPAGDVFGRILGRRSR